MTTKSEVYALLESLGGSLDEIAASLCEQNIKGEMGKSRTCPVALYLHRRGIYAEVMVKHTDVTMLVMGEESYSSVTIDNPNAVAEFVEAFDDHKFPELEVEVNNV